MTLQTASTRRQPVGGPTPTTDSTDAVLRLRRAEIRLEALAAALRALADPDATNVAQRRHCAAGAMAMLADAGL